MERNSENGGGVSANIMADICVLIPAPDYFEDPAPHCRALEAAFGFVPEYRAWTNPGDLRAFDLVLPLIAWGYQKAPEKWFALLTALELDHVAIANSVSILRWNSDKAYLIELANKGVAVVPTLMAQHLDSAALAMAAKHFGSASLIIKPPISGGAFGTYRINESDPVPGDVAGHRMMIQPFLPAIAAEGEYSLFYFNGEYSHAIIKRPAAGDFRVQDYLGGTEAAAIPPRDAIILAEAALNAAPAKCLYARADMLRDENGAMRLMELELIEPSLFLQYAPDKGAMFAKAVAFRAMQKIEF
jgi:glutathione synthase/RimK-type ligase-like ATP-grasp enzyme